MKTIRIFQHALHKGEPEVVQAMHIGQWLVERARSGARIDRRIYRGEPQPGNDIARDFDALMANDALEYTVLEDPGTGAEFIQALQIVIAIYSVASVLLASKPKMPSNVNRTQESPNNALGSRENQVRFLQRVEDIYGTVKAIPSVMMMTYNKYINNRKVEFGYYCVGRGYYDISELRDGDTLLDAIDGSSAAVYRPFESPNSGHTPQIQIGPAIIDKIVTVSRSVTVDGITLKAQNQIQLEPSAGYYLFQPGGDGGPPPPSGTIRPDGIYVPAAATDRVAQATKRPNFTAVVSPGETVTITVPDTTQARIGPLEVTGLTATYKDLGAPEAMRLFDNVYVGDTITFADLPDIPNNGTFTVLTKPDEYTVTVTYVTQVDSGSGVGTVSVNLSGAPYSGTRTVLEVGDGWLILAGTVFPHNRDDPIAGGPNVNIVANNGLSDWTNWITLPAPGRREVWTNVLAPNGMYKDNGGVSPTSVNYEMQLQQLDSGLSPIGGVVTAMGGLTGATTNERAETLEYATTWTGPTRVRMRRTTPFDYAFQGNVIDEIKWTDLYSVTPVDKLDFGNKTTIHTITEATVRSTAQRTRQLNCIASRLLPKWTGTAFTGAFDATGRHVSGTIHQTSFIHDIIAAVTLDPKIGNRPITDLHMAQLQGVVDQLYAIHPDLPTFNYTFDSDNTSFEETVTMIANAGFSIAYRQSGKIRLGLDRQQSIDATMFTHRNKDPDPESETITRTFANDSEYDGIEFVYSDPDTQQSETIRLPLDGSATKYKKFEIPGIRSFAQAWIRANREWRKLLGQRLTIETAGTTDARILLPNTRVSIVDNTRFKSFDGEVLARDGLLLTLSQRVEFTPGETHSIVLRKSDGSLQGITCFEVAGKDEQVLLETAPTEAVKTTDDADGVRTIFSFAADNKRAAQAWLVGEIEPPKGGYVVLRAVNYSDSYYEADTLPIPPKDSVIN